MKIHLIRSEQVDADLLIWVSELLNAQPGPISCISHTFDPVLIPGQESSTIDTEDDFVTQKNLKFDPSTTKNYYDFPFKRNEVTWTKLFEVVNSFRKQQCIPKEEFIFLLTDVANELNWFGSLQEEMPTNGFVHTADWEYYIKAPAAYPVAYQVLSSMIKCFMFSNMDEARRGMHNRSIGCISDFCKDKTDIVLKLRTGDICKPCLERLGNKLSAIVVDQAIRILDHLRSSMLFTQNFRQEQPAGRISVEVAKRRIRLAEHEQIEVKLRPLEMALYLLFLEHPEGIYRVDLPNYRQRLYDLYARVSINDGEATIRSRIDDMVSVLSNSADEKISRIKRAFEEKLGTRLSTHYYIRGDRNQPYQISVDRDLVQSI